VLLEERAGCVRVGREAQRLEAGGATDGADCGQLGSSTFLGA
jgi:hypothetical protein